MAKEGRHFLFVCGAFILALIASAAVYIHREDFYCLYLYARCETWERDNEIFRCETVKKLADNKSVRILCWMLRDNDSYVRLYAASALGYLDDKSAAEPLLEAMKKETNPDTCSTIISALSKLVDKGSLDRVIDLLKDDSADLRLQSATILNFAGDKRALIHLKEALVKEKDKHARIAIQEAIKTLENLPEKPPSGTEAQP